MWSSVDLKLDFQLCFDLKSLVWHSILPHSSFFLIQFFSSSDKADYWNKEYSTSVTKQNIYLCFERKRIFFYTCEKIECYNHGLLFVNRKYFCCCPSYVSFVHLITYLWELMFVCTKNYISCHFWHTTLTMFYKTVLFMHCWPQFFYGFCFKMTALNNYYVDLIFKNETE